MLKHLLIPAVLIGTAFSQTPTPSVQRLDMKLGLWEVTTSVSTRTNMTMPPSVQASIEETIAKLPPQQREQARAGFEKAMAANQAQMAKGIEQRHLGGA